MAERTVIAYRSAYPGSMCSHEDGGYIDREDAASLAAALLELLTAEKRRAEDAVSALAQRDAAIAGLIKAATVHASSCETNSGELRAPSMVAHAWLLKAIDRAAIGGASHG